MRILYIIVSCMLLFSMTAQADGTKNSDLDIKQEAFIADLQNKYKKTKKNTLCQESQESKDLDKAVEGALAKFYDFADKDRKAFIKTFNARVAGHCQTHDIDILTGDAAKAIVKKASEDSLTEYYAEKKQAKEEVIKQAEKLGEAPCTCKAVDFSKLDILSEVGYKDLVACGNKLHEERKKWETMDIKPVCESRMGFVASEIKTKEQESSKMLAIDRALEFRVNEFDFHFDAGYAFTSVNSLGTKGRPRASLGLYRTFSTDKHQQKMIKSGGLGFYGMHLATQFKLTDAGEQQAISLAAGAVKVGPKRVFEFESLAFFPIDHSKVGAYGKQRDYFFGPTMLWSAKKVGRDPAVAPNQNKTMLTSHYFGLRGAIGPESYTDIMLGRAEGASGTRLMIRGQMPYYIPSFDQVIYLGLEGNLGIKNRNNNASAETIRGYVTWRFDDFFSVLKGGSE